jgi:hypothetical protein
MNFADVLDSIAKPAPVEDESPFRRAAGSAAATEFWQVLDKIGEAPPISEERLKDAYFPDLPAPIVQLADLSLDPAEIAWELDIDSAVSLEELSSLRRRFAMLNHPDRTAPELRYRANQRMTIANGLIDDAAEKFAR